MRYSIIFVAILSIPVLAISDTIIVPDDYATIQEAIDAAVNGDTVLVRPGTYVENIDFKGKAITVTNDKWAGYLGITVIDGNQAGTVVTCQSDEGPDTVLDGFTITNGKATTGGGMINWGSSPTVMNCTFLSNEARKLLFGGWGGGMHNESGSSPTVSNCLFCNNKAVVPHGHSKSSGGGMYNGDNCSPMVTNCIFSGNGAGNGGGIYHGSISSLIVKNSTFSGNSADTGGALYAGDDVTTLTNCILWDNGPYEIDGNPKVTYSDVEGGYPGIGNIDSDPLFVDPANGDYHLTFNSPCRGSGDNTAVTELYDFEGDPRIAYGTVDMGADEFYTHLYVTGDKTPGGSIQGKFVGLPGTAPVGLFIGSGILPTPVNTMWGEYWLQAPWILLGPLGAIPSDGVMVLPATLPPGMTAPVDIPMQALIGLNADSLTNLCVLEVR